MWERAQRSQAPCCCVSKGILKKSNLEGKGLFGLQPLSVSHSSRGETPAWESGNSDYVSSAHRKWDQRIKPQSLSVPSHVLPPARPRSVTFSKTQELGARCSHTWACGCGISYSNHESQVLIRPQHTGVGGFISDLDKEPQEQTHALTWNMEIKYGRSMINKNSEKLRFDLMIWEIKQPTAGSYLYLGLKWRFHV